MSTMKAMVGIEGICIKADCLLATRDIVSVEQVHDRTDATEQ